MLIDVLHAWRSLRAMPLVSLVVIASLAIGIGANTVVFSWLQMVRWKPLPGVAAAASFQIIEPRDHNGVYVGTSWRDYLDFQERLRSFEWLLAFRMTPVSVGEAAQVERAAGLFVSGNYFSSLGLHPAAGRLLGPEDAAAPGGLPVVVISFDYWKNRFAGAASAIGATIRVNGETLSVVGVAPDRFQGTTLGLAFDMWLPATMAGVIVKGSRELDDRSQRGYVAMGRLRPAVPQPAAREELDAVMRELAREYPESHRNLRAEMLPFVSPPRGPQRMIGAALALLQALMFLVLVAVCGNTANLLLARASVRQREFGVRLALGASRWRAAGLLLLEALMLALAGAAVGTVLAIWGTQALRAGQISGALPIRFQTDIDGYGMAVALSLGVLSAILASAAPAWFMARMNPQQALRAGTRHASRSPLRQTLMGIQVALALFVLVVAGLFFQRFQESSDTDPGFRAEGVLLAAYDLTGRGTDQAGNRRFAARVLDGLRGGPGVESVALAGSIPLDIHGLPSREFALEGRAQLEADPDRALSNVVTPGYLQTMGIPLLAGTDFTPLDDTAAPPQVIVNDAFVRRFLEGGEAVGRRLQSRGVSYVIVGVARTSVYDAFGEPPPPLVMYSYRDRPLAAAEVHVRTAAGAEAATTAAIRRVVSDLDATLPVYDVRTLSDHISRNLVLRRVPARIFLVLGPLLLILAAIGIYAVVDYTVAQRASEIGLRLALGARIQQVVRQIVLESLGVVALGACGASVIAAVVDMHLVRGGARDIPVLVTVPILLIGVGAVACWLPARRAGAVDPAEVLRAP
jgi:predicted permease